MNILTLFGKKGKFFYLDITNMIHNTSTMKEWFDFVFSEDWEYVEMISSVVLMLWLWDWSGKLWKYKTYDTLEKSLDAYFESKTINDLNGLRFEILSKRKEVIEVEIHNKNVDWYAIDLIFENWDAIEYSWVFEYKDLPYVVNRVIYENNLI